MVLNPKHKIIRIIALIVCVCFLWQDVVWAAGPQISAKRGMLRTGQFAEFAEKQSQSAGVGGAGSVKAGMAGQAQPSQSGAALNKPTFLRSGIPALQWRELLLGFIGALLYTLGYVGFKFSGIFIFLPSTVYPPSLSIEGIAWLHNFYPSVMIPAFSGFFLGYLVAIIIHELGHQIAVWYKKIPAIIWPSKIGLVWVRITNETQIVPVKDEGVRRAGPISSGLGAFFAVVAGVGALLGWWPVTNAALLIAVAGASTFFATADKPNEGIWQRNLSIFEFALPVLVIAGVAFWIGIGAILGSYAWVIRGAVIGSGLLILVMLMERIWFGGIGLRTKIRKDWKKSEEEFVRDEVCHTFHKITGLSPDSRKFREYTNEFVDRFTANTYPSNQRAFLDAYGWVERIAKALAAVFIFYLATLLFNIKKAIVMVKFATISITSFFHSSDVVSQLASNEEYRKLLNIAIPGEGGRIHADIALRWILEKGHFLGPYNGTGHLSPNGQGFLTALEVELRAGLRYYAQQSSNVPQAIQQEIERILSTGKTPFKLEDVISPGVGPIWEYVTVATVVLLVLFLMRYSYHHFMATAGYYMLPPLDLVRRHRYQPTEQSAREIAHELIHMSAANAKNRKRPLVRHDAYGATLVDIVRAIEQADGKLDIVSQADKNESFNIGRKLARKYSLEEAVQIAAKETKVNEGPSIHNLWAEDSWGYDFGAMLGGILGEKAQGNIDELWNSASCILLLKAPRQNKYDLELRKIINQIMGVSNSEVAAGEGVNSKAKKPNLGDRDKTVTTAGSAGRVSDSVKFTAAATVVTIAAAARSRSQAIEEDAESARRFAELIKTKQLEDACRAYMVLCTTAFMHRAREFRRLKAALVNKHCLIIGDNPEPVKTYLMEALNFREQNIDTELEISESQLKLIMKEYDLIVDSNKGIIYLLLDKANNLNMELPISALKDSALRRKMTDVWV